MSARWQVVTSDAGPRLRLIGGNGESVLTSEVYEDDESALNAIRVAGTTFGLPVETGLPELAKYLDVELVDERTPEAEVKPD